MTRISGRALAELLPDLTAHPGPRYSALADAVTGLLLDGRVALGTKLPSERELAASLQLSRATVTNAYDALRAEGLLTSRTGSGSVTALPRRPHPESGAIGRAPVPTRGPVERRFARFANPGPATGGGIIDLAVAVMPAPPELSVAAAHAATQLHLFTDRGGYEPAGIPDLRAGIADRFTGRGVPTTPEQILITNGAQSGIDLLLRLLVAPGERVLTELPTYPGLLDAIRANGARYGGRSDGPRRGLADRADDRSAAAEHPSDGSAHSGLPQPDRSPRRRGRPPRNHSRRASRRNDDRGRRIVRRPGLRGARDPDGRTRRRT